MRALKDIVIYVEGGGDSAQQRAELRAGFDGLFNNVKTKAKAAFSTMPNCTSTAI